MLQTAHRQISQRCPPTPRSASKADTEALHRKCGVYTKPDVVRSILDGVGWKTQVKLFKARLLEPSAGDGAFVVEAARRLIQSCRKYDIDPKSSTIGHCIRAFELHAAEATKARRRVFNTLRELHVHPSAAAALARSWVICGDFLLSKPAISGFTHAVGNPPYVRWSKIPQQLKAKYRNFLPQDMIGGDLFLPFLDRALTQLIFGGKFGFLCSDRWRYMAFAEGFRKKWLPHLNILSENSLLSTKAFIEAVDAYPTILIAVRCRARVAIHSAPSLSGGKTLEEIGCIVKVGPALGHTAAFVLQPDEHDVEAELLRPWIHPSEIVEGKIEWEGRHVVVMHNADGTLIDLTKFPKLRSRLKRFQTPLENRSIVRSGAIWYRPIDRILAAHWERPKLLVPELAKIPRVAIDRSGAIPSHGVYAIFAPEEKIDSLYDRLGNGRLAEALEGVAPKVKGGFVRCYKRFLDMIILD